MNKPLKTKLCWNCEGSVSRSAENCPYCAVYLNPDTEDLKEKEELSIKAPYSFDKKSNEIPKAPYSPSQSQEDVHEANGTDHVKEDVLPAEQTLFQSLFLPLIFLTTGLIAIFFALILFLFAENGKLTLQWNAEYWYIYAVIALPLLFLGWKNLNDTKET